MFAWILEGPHVDVINDTLNLIPFQNSSEFDSEDCLTLAQVP